MKADRLNLTASRNQLAGIGLRWAGRWKIFTTLQTSILVGRDQNEDLCHEGVVRMQQTSPVTRLSRQEGQEQKLTICVYHFVAPLL